MARDGLVFASGDLNTSDQGVRDLRSASSSARLHVIFSLSFEIPARNSCSTGNRDNADKSVTSGARTFTRLKVYRPLKGCKLKGCELQASRCVSPLSFSTASRCENRPCMSLKVLSEGNRAIPTVSLNWSTRRTLSEGISGKLATLSTGGASPVISRTWIDGRDLHRAKHAA